MNIGDRVRLVTFNGINKPKFNTLAQENYWILIGETGVVVKSPTETTIYASFSKLPRVLVNFKKDMSGCGLIAHNEIENSLWILITDLEVISTT